MTLDKQQLTDRIAALNNDMMITRANYAKLEGHLAESTHWLSELIKLESEIVAPENEGNKTENPS